MKNQISKIPVLVAFLTIIPLVCGAFSFEEPFDDFEEWISDLSDGMSSTHIINEVKVLTNTGNNVINGEITEGEAKSRIFIKNVINGKEIDPIEIESDKNEIKVESQIKTENGKVIIQREIQIDSEKSTENYEVDLENSETETESEGILKDGLDSFQEGWLDFIEDLRSFFDDIFNIFKLNARIK